MCCAERQRFGPGLPVICLSTFYHTLEEFTPSMSMNTGSMRYQNNSYGLTYLPIVSINVLYVDIIILCASLYLYLFSDQNK